MITVLITLSIAGTDSGPYDLYSSPDGITFTVFATGITKSALLAGYTSYVVPDGSTTIRIMSTGTCTNYIDLTISGGTTTTTTSVAPTTTTTTTGASNSIVVKYSFGSGGPVTYYGYSTGNDACTDGPASFFSITLYYSGVLGNGTQLFSNPALTSQFVLTSPGYLYVGGYSFYLAVSTISSYAVCTVFPTTTTTTTVSPNLIPLKMSTDQFALCNTSFQNYYTAGGSLSQGTQIFTDAALTVAYNGGATYVTSGFSIFNLSGNTVGTLTAINCP